MAITFTKGGSTITPEYQPAQVYSRTPLDKVFSVAFDDATLTEAEVGAVFPDPSAFDGEDIVIGRGVRTLILGADGDGSMTTQTGLATTGGRGTGLTVDVTAAGGVATAIAVNDAGAGYGLGDVITITTGESGADAAITATVGLIN